MWRLKLDQELTLMEGAEIILKEFCQDFDEAMLHKAKFEKLVEQLVAEIKFLKKQHEEEVADLVKQIGGSKITTELDSDQPDLATCLRNIRAEIETVAARCPGN